MKAENTLRPLLDGASRIRLGELTQVGVAMTEDEMKAVCGARKMEPSWSCGSPQKTDEWNVYNNG